jgi:hypothetical protein
MMNYKYLLAGVAIIFTLFLWQIGSNVSNGKKIDITANGPDGLPGIFWLIKQDDRAAVGAWLDAGGSIETPGFLRSTPVLSASMSDSWPMVLYLIERGARLDVADRQGFTLAYNATTTRVDPNGSLGPALRDVRQRLTEAGLLERVYNPDEVNAMQADGSWPPVSLRIP